MEVEINANMVEEKLEKEKEDEEEEELAEEEEETNNFDNLIILTWQVGKYNF